MTTGNYSLSRRSRNQKLWQPGDPYPVAATIAPQDTCPEDCGARDQCYAKGGKMAIVWRRLSRGEIGVQFQDLLDGLRKLPKGWLTRLWQAGDFAGPDALRALTAASMGRLVWTYTHRKNQAMYREVANTNRAKSGLTVNLSADTLAEVDTLSALNVGPVVVTLALDAPKTLRTPGGRLVVVCPAQQREAEKYTCSRCAADGGGMPLCARSERKYAIGFRAHGVWAHKMTKRLNVINNQAA